MSVNLIKSMVLGNIQTMKIVNVEKKLVDLLVEECTEIINETSLVKKTLDKNENKEKCRFYVVYKVLVFILFIICIEIGICFVYRKYVDHNEYELLY